MFPPSPPLHLQAARKQVLCCVQPPRHRRLYTHIKPQLPFCHPHLLPPTRRQRQCRSFAACGFPDIEAPASPETLIRQHFRGRRRPTSAAEAHTRVPRRSADLSRYRRSQPGGDTCRYLSGGSGDGSVGGVRGGVGWAKETGADAPPPAVPAALEPSAPPEPQPPGAHIPLQPPLSAPLHSTQGVHHPQLLPPPSSQHHKHLLQQQQQQQQQQREDGRVFHQHQPCDHDHHHHYQQDGQLLHQHQLCHLQPHQLQHRHHQSHVYQHGHGHKQQSGHHMLDSPFVDMVDGEVEIQDASGGSGAEKEVEEWDEDWMGAEEWMDGVVDDITLEWAEVVQWWDPFFYALKHIRGGSGDLLSVSPGTPSVSEPVPELFPSPAHQLPSPSPVHQLPSPSLVSIVTEASREAMIAASAKKQLLLLFGTCACVWLWVIAKWPRDGRLRGHVLGSAFVAIFGTHAAGNSVMAMPSDLPTRALYITSFTNMSMWGLLIPLLFK
ncbi:hypothetical protein DUNSADRAFT_3497 [Dunaliella salina]|uniref:Uncharacterized protein n=1 Tax=Dunaliella salina TaxID=3046 RepID=A0ABQ7FVC1_DUNSA|nr:hypothetical protein DUNSADRAFT_3497 [Dunaliella salina]|eukprot:KAF5826338.1 hypothetical protein DUNSADRAFT_3497 [Dunaliella salina]